MSTSFEAFPPPGAVYPTTGETNPITTTPYHSSGSYGTVFVVLAIIVVVSAVACVLGRFCGKRSSGQQKTKKSKNQGHDGRPRSHNKAADYSNGRSKGRDVELGFGEDIEIGFDKKKIPKVKVAPNGHGYGHGPGMQGQRPPQNGPGPGHHGGAMPPQNGPGGGPRGHRLLPMMECPRNF